MKAIAAGDIDGKIASRLEALGFELFFTKPSEGVLPALKYHPDMQIARSGGFAVCEPSGYEYYSGFIGTTKVTAVKGESVLTSNYPGDIAYNISEVGDYIFHSVGHTDAKVVKAAFGKTFINVAQGYSGCSICRIGGNAIITADISIHRAACAHGIDSLLISVGGIYLPGFDFGFIGGASFYFKNTVYFFGRISSHPDYEKIKVFCDKHEKNICELSDGVLSDYGSLITLD